MEISHLILQIVGAVMGVGAFWVGIVLWAVKALLQRQHEAVQKMVNDHDAQVDRRLDNYGGAVAELQRNVINHGDSIHRLDMESLKLRNELYADFRETYVHRREFDEIKVWMREINEGLQAVVRDGAAKHASNKAAAKAGGQA